ncbi:MAG: hypothetical protein IPK70_14435 [Flavobacteriales bacterium]|nr:hypothetical protein [Flavobacteriales bacterium]
MKLQDNIYFQSYEYGFNHPEGLTLNELLAYLKEKGHVFDANAERYFQHWFFLNFFNESATWQTQVHEHGRMGSGIVNIKDYYDKKSVMTGEAMLRYVDILELMQARDHAAKANENATKSIQLSEEASRHAADSTRTARHSLWATIGALVVTILLGLWQVFGQVDEQPQCCDHGERETQREQQTIKANADALVNALTGRTIREAIALLKVDTSQFYVFDEPPGILRGMNVQLNDSTVLSLNYKRRSIIDKPYRGFRQQYLYVVDDTITAVSIKQDRP